MSGRPRVLSFTVNGPAIAGKWCLPGSSRSWAQRARRLLQRPLNGTRCTRPHDSRCPCTCREPPVPGMVITTCTTSILGRVMDSFAPVQECARIRPGIRLRHPASRPRTRTHGSMSGHNAPGTLQADTGHRTQDAGRRTKDRTGQEEGTHRHTDSGPATKQEQHIQPGSPPKQGRRQYRINNHAPDTVAARSGPQYPLSRSACPRSDRRMPLPARSRRAGTPAGLTPFPFTPCHETRHPQGRFP